MKIPFFLFVYRLTRAVIPGFVLIGGLIVNSQNISAGMRAEEPCMTNLVSYFRFSEGSGATTSDEVSSRTLDVEGNAGWADGKVGSGISFNGVDQRLTLSDDPDFDWSSSHDFTIELWCKLEGDQEGYQVFIGRETSGSTHWWVGLNAEKRPAFYLYDEMANGGGVLGSDSINDGEWHHIAAVHIASQGRNQIWVDGILHGDSISTYTAGFSSDSDIEIGIFYSGLAHKFFFRGVLDEIAISNRALPGSEVYAHYVKGAHDVDYCGVYTQAPSITSEPDTLAVTGQAYTYRPEAEGYPTPLFDLIQAPSGMTLNTGTNTILWTPTQGGNYDVLIRAANPAGNDFQSYTINVLEPCIDGLKSYLNFDEGNGEYTRDQGNLELIEIGGNASWTSGKAGYALSFNGINQGLSFSPHPVFEWTQYQDFTLELWFRSSSATDNLQVMIGRDTPGSTHWWMGLTTEHRPAFYLYDESRNGGGITGPESLNDGDWHHLGVVYKGLEGSLFLYVDGTLSAGDTLSYAGNFSSEAELQIAMLYYNMANSFFFEGQIDEIAMLNRALSGEELLAHYLKGVNDVSYCDDLVLAPEIISEPILSAFSNDNYRYDVNASGLPAPVYQLTTCPDGMSVDSVSGVIQWTPSEPGTFDVEVVAKNAGGEDIQAFTLSIIDACITEGICYFSFDEAGGPLVTDPVSGLEGSLVQGPERMEGVAGNCLSFNGSDQSVIIPDNDVFDFAAGSGFSFELWCRPVTGNSSLQVFLGRDEPEGVQWWIGLQADTKLPVIYAFDENREGNGLTGLIPFTDGKWHHLAGVYDVHAELLMLYIDGILNNQLEVSFTAGFSAESVIQIGCLYIGGSFQYFYEGELDEVAVYNRALTAGEVSLHHSMGKAGLSYCFTEGETDLTPYNGSRPDCCRIYPVPAQEMLFIQLATPSSGNVRIQLINLLGEIHHEEAVFGTELIPVDVSGFPWGYYVMRFIVDDEIIGQESVIIRP